MVTFIIMVLLQMKRMIVVRAVDVITVVIELGTKEVEGCIML